MASNMKVLLTGYSGYAQIDGYDTLMTSFSLSMNENVLQSGGIGRILKENDRNTVYNNRNNWTVSTDNPSVFDRYKLNAVRDYPGYEISIGVEANFEILNYLFTQITTNFHSFISLKFQDDASGILYEFDKSCLTSFTLSIGNNVAATLQFTFITFKDEIEVNICPLGYNELAKRDAPDELVGAVLMPYWAWGIETQDLYGNYLNDEDLFELSISYSQNVTPKFGCFGNQSYNAIGPNKIIFGVPEVKYDLTYIVANPANVSDYLIQSNQVAISRRDILVKYYQILPENSVKNQDSEKEIDFSFTMKNCYPDSYSTQYWNQGDVNKISVSGTVYGKIEYDKTDTDGV